MDQECAQVGVASLRNAEKPGLAAVGDTLVTQDISEPVEERCGVVVSNRGARAVRSASRAEIRERKAGRQSQPAH